MKGRRFTYTLIETPGYHCWEETIRPRIPEAIVVEITLTPDTYPEPTHFKPYKILPILESARPDPATAMSSTFEINAERAERAHSREIITYQDGHSIISAAKWELDRFGRIY